MDAVGRGTPHAEPLGSRFGLACQQLGDAGTVVGEGVDAGKPLGDQLLLQQQPRPAADDEDLGERMAVAVDAAPANLKLDVGARGELVERLLGLLDQRPGILAPPAERGQRRLGADQPDDPAITELTGFRR